MNKSYKRLLRPAFIIPAAIGLFIIALLAYVMRPRNKEYKIPDYTDWQTGYIFFSSGTSWKSDIVRLFGGGGEYNTSHCGIVLIHNGRPMLVHMSTDKGMITMESVEEYGKLNGATGVRAVKPKVMPDTTVLRNRIEYLFKQGKKFDKSFDHSDTTEYYCSEFVVREMARAGNHSYDHLLSDKVIYPQDIEAIERK